MKYTLSALAALIATPAFAHSGHTELVGGHTHTLVDLALMSAGPAFLVIVAAVVAARWLKQRND